MGVSIGQIRDRIQAVINVNAELPEIAAEAADKYRDVLLSLNRDQMLLGRDADGNELSPSYLNDPYFKTPEAARNYANMKYVLEQTHRSFIQNPILFPEKGKNTPNLIVRGDFQAGLYISVSGSSYTIGSTYNEAGDINDKYNGRVFGVAPESRQYFFYSYIAQVYFNRVKLKIKNL